MSAFIIVSMKYDQYGPKKNRENSHGRITNAKCWDIGSNLWKIGVTKGAGWKGWKNLKMIVRYPSSEIVDEQSTEQQYKS